MGEYQPWREPKVKLHMGFQLSGGWYPNPCIVQRSIVYAYIKSLCCVPKMNNVVCKYYLNFFKLAKNKNTSYKYRNGKNLNASCVIGLELGDDSVKLLSSI